MLAIEPARTPGIVSGKLGIALAGGGPLGAFFELGALHAIGEAVEGRDLTDFDVYVGVSSGALVASGLVNGFDTTTIGEVFVEDAATRQRFTPEMLLQPALGEYARRLLRLPGALADILRAQAHEPLGSLWLATVGALARTIPTAVFANEPLERFLRESFTAEGHTDDFRLLRRRLYVVATNLNTGESVHFGEPGRDHVPISRAVCASSALPGLYPAVEIDGDYFVDGALIRTMNASLALEEGCDLVICINPLVPFDASRVDERRRVSLMDEGLPAVMSQTFRALIHSRMQVGMASYMTRFPQADTLLLEPDRQDERLFFTNVFRFAGRRNVVEHAYRHVRADLLAQAPALAPVLSRHGLVLNTDVLRDRSRTFRAAATERRKRTNRTTQRLGDTLDQLEGLLEKWSRAT